MRLVTILFLSTILLLGCSDNNKTDDKSSRSSKDIKATGKTGMHFEGAVLNGMKGDSISFDISADGKILSNLTFKGYWRCGGRLESTITGPEGVFTIIDNKVNDHISEPPNGGSTAWRYELEATINGNTAAGTFRMNINNLGCDSYKLQWTATGK